MLWYDIYYFYYIQTGYFDAIGDETAVRSTNNYVTGYTYIMSIIGTAIISGIICAYIGYNWNTNKLPNHRYQYVEIPTVNM